MLPTKNSFKKNNIKGSHVYTMDKQNVSFKIKNIFLILMELKQE